MKSLSASFFNLSPIAAAEGLIGATLTHGATSGLIVETEAYSEKGDEACHTFCRKSARAFVESHPPGTAYVYLNFGMYWLANILVEAPSGERGFVLLRALEPLTGIDLMKERRRKRQSTELCSGPGKLTIALGIDGSHHEKNFQGDPFVLTPGTSPPEVVTGPRIGISKAKDFPWRFGLAGSPHLSRSF